MKIWCVEDDASIRDIEIYTLNSTGFEARGFENGEDFFAALAQETPDLVILDVMLPGMDGVSILRKMKDSTATKRLPVIMATAKGMEYDKIQSLDLGADDYLVKPFGAIELMARIRTAIRHTVTVVDNDGIALNGLCRVGELTIDYRKHRVFLSGRDTGLTPNEFRIVALLGKHSGQVVTYKAILRELWGPYATHDNKILRVHMANIRRKIEPNPDEPTFIFTEVGVGYRMADCD